MWEEGKEEKIMGYGTTNLCTTDKHEAAKEIGNRAEVTRSVYKEALSENPGQCERRARFRDSKELGMF